MSCMFFVTVTIDAILIKVKTCAAQISGKMEKRKLRVRCLSLISQNTFFFAFSLGAIAIQKEACFA